MTRQRLTFEQWMSAVNAALIRKCGMDSQDLPDWRYRDAYDDGCQPQRAAARALAAAKKELGYAR